MFPDDTELLLLGAELAIAGGEWSRAEALLQERSYPAAFKDRATALEVILIERKSESGKITIRFPANSQEIPIDILLNKRVLQRFIIDTGADVVSIPSESVQKLGITLDENTPVHRISTASGYSLAYEVNLNLMEIKGYRVHNIQALVLDIPGAPGVGLLGQNFLKHFELEIDSKKGLLRLKRR
jgi:clan AA aspartic protease (TIGR02281 family)